MAGPVGVTRVANLDPLLALLQRYRAERQAFDDAATAGMTNEDWDSIAEATWWGTQTKIIESEPSVTTAAGALLALDHVLQSGDLFAERSESADLQLLWLLTKAARDYVASLVTAAPNDHANDNSNDNNRVHISSSALWEFGSG
jgi:hypothetical protein